MASEACFYRENRPFDELVYLKMAAGRGISLSDLLVVEVILNV